MAARNFDREAGSSLWRQIAHFLETRILDSTLPTGVRLPTETQLADAFDVNRHTLRRALRELARKGLITATPRRGTFVSKRRIAYPIMDDETFRGVTSTSNEESGGRLISHTIGFAPREMTEWLDIAERGQVVEIKFLRTSNEIPICLTTAWLPADRFERAGELFARLGRLSAALSKLGVTKFKQRRTRITSQPASEEEARLLDTQRGSTLLVVEVLHIDDEGEPIVASHMRFAADRIELVVDG